MKCLNFLLIVLLASTVYGKTLQVGPGQAYSRIEDAVAAANAGDKIIVHPLPNDAAPGKSLLRDPQPRRKSPARTRPRDAALRL